MTASSWASWAEGHLRAHWRQAVESALSNSKSARWHPNGFMVFRLDEVSEGDLRGSRRVHIWPGGVERKEMPGHPTIHSHDWELQSLVLAGKYSDVIFEISTDAPALLTHAVKYDAETGDSIEPTGDGIRLVQREVRDVHAGDCHHMDVGVPHETLVPMSETVVTHVMMGPRHVDGMMLAGEAAFTAKSFTRPALSDVEQDYARKTLSALL